MKIVLLKLIQYIQMFAHQGPGKFKKRLFFKFQLLKMYFKYLLQEKEKNWFKEKCTLENKQNFFKVQQANWVIVEKQKKFYIFCNPLSARDLLEKKPHYPCLTCVYLMSKPVRFIFFLTIFPLYFIDFCFALKYQKKNMTARSFIAYAKLSLAK